MGEVTYPKELLRPLGPPEPLSAAHDLSRFECGKAPLDDWLRQKALKSEGASSRTFVVHNRSVVVGYYCLATGGVIRDGIPRKFRHDPPNPVPVMILGRLAVDKGHQRKGIGSGLLKDALSRILRVSQEVGCRSVLVHAIDDEAKAFYAGYNFVEFPFGTRTMHLPVEVIAKAL